MYIGSDWIDVNSLTKICAKTIFFSFFYISILTDLHLCPLVLKFALLVTLAYVSTKLEVSTAFLLFRENRRAGTDGQTDGRSATLNAAP